MTGSTAHAAMLKNAVRLLGAALFACAPSLVNAFLLPYNISVAGDISPWAPTPADHVILTIADTYDECGYCQGGSPASTQVSRAGNVFTVTVTWIPTPGAVSSAQVYNFQVDLGPLPIGQYTVKYLHVPNLDFLPSPELVSIGFTVSATGYATAVEYFAPSLGHYFITSDSSEIAALDSAEIPGWARTGETFHVIPAAAQPTSALSVCRFYGLPQAGLNSHFFTSLQSECQAVQQLWPNAWILESPDAFAVLPLAASGFDCPAGSVSLYRLYNNRRDANHRYTTSPAIRDQMIAMGWLLEGDATSQGYTAMCAPG